MTEPKRAPGQLDDAVRSAYLQLFARAPKMYEAMQKIAADPTHPWRDHARKAIARVKGTSL